MFTTRLMVIRPQWESIIAVQVATSSIRGSWYSSSTVSFSRAILEGGHSKTLRVKVAILTVNEQRVIWKSLSLSISLAQEQIRVCLAARSCPITSKIARVSATRLSAKSSNFVTIIMGKKREICPLCRRDRRRSEKKRFKTSNIVCLIRLWWPLTRRSYSRSIRQSKSAIQRTCREVPQGPLKTLLRLFPCSVNQLCWTSLSSSILRRKDPNEPVADRSKRATRSTNLLNTRHKARLSQHKRANIRRPLLSSQSWTRVESEGQSLRLRNRV